MFADGKLILKSFETVTCQMRGLALKNLHKTFVCPKILDIQYIAYQQSFNSFTAQIFMCRLRALYFVTTKI